MASQRRTEQEVAAYIAEYLDPGNHLSHDDDPAETVAELDRIFADSPEGGSGVTVEEMARYLKSLPRSATQIADLLNAYEAEHDDTTTYNIWGDLINSLPEYDAEATEEEDSSGMSNVVVLKDGSVVRHAPDQGRWIVRG